MLSVWNVNYIRRKKLQDYFNRKSMLVIDNLNIGQMLCEENPGILLVRQTQQIIL
jgi:hypothetical protein